MVYKLFLCLYFAALLDILIAKEIVREVEGYPYGYLSDCPGVTKPAKISNRSLRKLSFYHLSRGDLFTANKTEYNYYKMKYLAKKLDFKRKTIVYMNAYMDMSRLQVSLAGAFGTLYTERGYNVLIVEYFQFSAYMYPVAARLLRPVGEKLAKMLAELTRYGLDPKKLQLIGFNLGGQGISFIAKHYREITGRNVSRITGLDPAGPCFRRLGPEHRIDASDADMVDVIHTNNDQYGIAGAVGHVNVYVNGGEHQTFDFIAYIPCTGLCSHIRAFTIWISSVMNPDKFVARQCDSIQDARDNNCWNGTLVTNLLGPKTDFSKPGIYHLQTWNTFPYFMGKEGVTKNFYDEYLGDLNKNDLFVA